MAAGLAQERLSTAISIRAYQQARCNYRHMWDAHALSRLCVPGQALTYSAFVEVGRFDFHLTSSTVRCESVSSYAPPDIVRHIISLRLQHAKADEVTAFQLSAGRVPPLITVVDDHLHQPRHGDVDPLHADAKVCRIESDEVVANRLMGGKRVRVRTAQDVSQAHRRRRATRRSFVADGAAQDGPPEAQGCDVALELWALTRRTATLQPHPGHESQGPENKTAHDTFQCGALS